MGVTERMQLLLGALLGGAIAALLVIAASAPSEEKYQQAMEKVLREQPELIFEVLRKDSELVFTLAQEGNELHKHNALRAQWKEDLKVPKTLSLEGGFVRGKPDAPVKIVVFSDFACPPCVETHAALQPLLKKYGDDLVYIFTPWPRNNVPGSLAAAVYTVGAFLQNEEAGWRLHDTLFAQPDLFIKKDETALRALVQELGLDLETLQIKQAGDIIVSVRKEADRLKVAGVPHFFINDLVIRGSASQELLEEAIELALKNAKK